MGNIRGAGLASFLVLVIMVAVLILISTRAFAAPDSDALLQALRTQSLDHGSEGAFSLPPLRMLEGVSPELIQELSTASLALQQNPRDTTALVQRGVAAQRAGQQSRYTVNWRYFAAKDFERALSIEPNNFYAHHNYADLLYKWGDNTPGMPVEHMAIEHFSRAIALKPDSARSYMGRGWAYLMVSDEARASSDFQRALQLDPGLRSQLVEVADAIRQTRGQGACIAGTLSRLGSYRVDRRASTGGECAALHGLWTGSECRVSTAMTPGVFSGEASCAPPHEGADMHRATHGGGFSVR